MDLADFDVWFAHVGLPTGEGPAAGDFNQDALVDLADFDVWLQHVGSPVPLRASAAAANDLHVSTFESVALNAVEGKSLADGGGSWKARSIRMDASDGLKALLRRSGSAAPRRAGLLTGSAL